MSLHCRVSLHTGTSHLQQVLIDRKTVTAPLTPPCAFAAGGVIPRAPAAHCFHGAVILLCAAPATGAGSPSIDHIEVDCRYFCLRLFSRHDLSSPGSKHAPVQYKIPAALPAPSGAGTAAVVILVAHFSRSFLGAGVLPCTVPAAGVRGVPEHVSAVGICRKNGFRAIIVHAPPDPERLRMQTRAARRPCARHFSR